MFTENTYFFISGLCDPSGSFPLSYFAHHILTLQHYHNEISDDVYLHLSSEEENLAVGEEEKDSLVSTENKTVNSHDASLPKRQPDHPLSNPPEPRGSETQNYENNISNNAPVSSKENSNLKQHNEVHTDLSTNQDSCGSAEESKPSSSSSWSWCCFPWNSKCKKGLKSDYF